MARVSRQDLLAPAGTRDLLYVMSEEQVNHERTAVRSCGPCLTNVFINDLCVWWWGRGGRRARRDAEPWRSRKAGRGEEGRDRREKKAGRARQATNIY